MVWIIAEDIIIAYIWLYLNHESIPQKPSQTVRGSPTVKRTDVIFEIQSLNHEKISRRIEQNAVAKE